MMMLYPLYDSNLMAASKEAVNFVISLCYRTWDITNTQCSIRVKREYSSLMCFMELHLLLVYLEHIIQSVGKLFDNWLNWINLSMNKLILERKEFSDVGGGCRHV